MKFPPASDIRRIRKALDITQTELAKESGVSQSTIAKIEKDRISASYETVVKLFETLDEMAKNSKQQPKNPHPAVRYQSMRTSNAMLLYRLKYSGGKHLISFTSESDLFSQNAKQSWADTSVLVRLAYDGDRYSSDYKSDSAVNGVIDEVLWNMTLCCTPDALYRSVRNYTNGEVTRLAIARTPDNTFSPLVDYGQNGIVHPGCSRGSCSRALHLSHRSLPCHSCSRWSNGLHRRPDGLVRRCLPNFVWHSD